VFVTPTWPLFYCFDSCGGNAPLPNGIFPVDFSLSQTCNIPDSVQCDNYCFFFLIDVANGGCLKFEDEFIQRCMTIIGGASQHLNMV